MTAWLDQIARAEIERQLAHGGEPDTDEAVRRVALRLYELLADGSISPGDLASWRWAREPSPD